jgi:uncharacterized membrane protein YdjX (TVP38/TMEM64 family)
MKQSHIYKLLIVAVLILTGIALDTAGLLEPEIILGIARGYAEHWWLSLVLILLQVVLFTFALAGSLFLWVAAPLYPPAIAALILATGGTLGGITAYLFSKRLTDEWIARIEKSHAYRLLHQQDNFFTLFAMRVFPAFPHSLVNYSSGILQVKLSHFIPAAFLGIYIKSYIYAKVIYSATSSASVEDLLNISTFGPLVALSLLSLAGVYIRHRLGIGVQGDKK